MSNSNHSAKFINMLIALMASIAIALTCIVPTALAEDGDGTDDNNGGSTVQPAGPVPNIIITNFTYGDGSVAVGTISILASPSRIWARSRSAIWS